MLKKYLLVAFVLVWATPSIAQAPAEYNFKLTPADVELIGKALGKLPYEDVAVLFQKLRQQAAEQQQPKTEPEKK